jgi:flagellar biosynthesis protein FlhF
MFGAIKRFGRLPISSLIFTKLDECEGLGSILNVHLKHDCPISYLTNGQRVPEDLLLADPRRVAGLVMGKLKE